MTRNRKKILFIITDLGSFNNFLSELALKVVKTTNIDLHVICSNSKVININDKFDFSSLNITFHYVDIPRTINLFKLMSAALDIRAIISKIKPAIVDCHFTTGIFPTILFKVKHIEYWGTFHGLGMNSSVGLKKVIFSIVEWYSIRRLNAVFLVNEKDYVLVKSLRTNNIHKYKSYGFGCPLEKYNILNYTTKNLIDLKDKLDIGGEFVITYIGRYVEFKGFDLVVQSFTKLSTPFPSDYKLILLGGHDPIHPTGLSKMEEGLLQNRNDIIDIGFTNDIPDYLAISDILLFPSKKEGLPTCVIESLAMGVPAIVSDSRGSNDLIKDFENGLLISSSHEDKSSEVDEIVNKIELLYKNRSLLKQMSNNCLQDRAKLSREIFIEDHIKMYLRD